MTISPKANSTPNSIGNTLTISQQGNTKSTKIPSKPQKPQKPQTQIQRSNYTQGQRKSKTNGRVSTFSCNESVLKIGYVKEIDLQIVKPQRAGVILYTFDERGELFFGFGNDTKTNDITDFAGGVNYKKDKNVICGALRECKEETLGMYNFDEKTVQEYNCIYDAQNFIIFIPIEGMHPLKISNLFKEKYINKCEEFKRLGSSRIPEVSSILWFNGPDIEKLIRKNAKIGPIMFSRLRNFLLKIGTKKIIELL